jgi:hypothetical protein
MVNLGLFSVSTAKAKPVSTTALALYAAVVSTVTAVVQILNHRRDRAKVVLEERKNMREPPSQGHIASPYVRSVIITATNIGRRPVTIAGFGARLLYRDKEKSVYWDLAVVRPHHLRL